MCGFIGFTEKKDIKKYKNILYHRGPDNISFFINDNISLLHNRLSIIDISDKANQPFVSETGNVIVFNGEIYNYKEIKKKFNLDCKTFSDTEVIIKLYEKIGLDFVNYLNGIFSFVIYDKQKRKVFLFRDRFGIKPLFYKFTKNSLSFASEAKALLSDNIEYNEQTLYDYLEFGLLTHNENTFFTNIYSLKAAHFMEYDLFSKKFEINRYWDIELKEFYLNENEILEKTYELLNDSMKLNLVSDVEVAISLSSGTDSTLLTKLAQNYQQKFKAFTFGFEEKEYDEVRRVKENFDLSNLELYPVYLKKQEMLKELKESIYYFETPLGGLGTLSAYNMMKEVKKHDIKVILAGEGSDEIFGGYQYYYPAFFSDLKDENQIKQELEFYTKKHNKNIKFNSKEYQEFLKLIRLNKVLAPDGTTSIHSHIGKGLENFKHNIDFKINKFKSNLSNLMYQDMFIKKLPKLLHFQDRASMANSVEARVPFLDYRLVEFLYSLPSEYKIRNGETKYLLKQILKEKLNYKEKRKTKHYVATPQREWIKDKKIKNEILEIVRYSKLNKLEYINFNKFVKDYEKYANSSELGNSFFVWKIINLVYLMEQKWI